MIYMLTMSDTFHVPAERLDQFIGRMIPLLNERDRRLFVGSVAELLGRGGLKYMKEATGMSSATIVKGQKESLSLPCDPKARKNVKEEQPIRQAGAGRKSIVESNPSVTEQILLLLDGHVVGNPENPLCWTTKSTYSLSDDLKEKGFSVSPSSVSRLLKAEGFSLQQTRKYVEKGT